MIPGIGRGFADEIEEAKKPGMLTDRDRKGKKLTQRLRGRNHRSRSTGTHGHNQRNTHVRYRTEDATCGRYSRSLKEVTERAAPPPQVHARMRGQLSAQQEQLGECKGLSVGVNSG